MRDGGGLESPTATVTIEVSEVNDPPQAATDKPSVAEDGILEVDPRTNDAAGEAGQSLSIRGLTRPEHGSSTLVGDTAVRYTPDADYHGPDVFSYTVCDDGTTAGEPDSRCDTADVEVTVTAVNDAPTAVGVAILAAEDTASGVSLTASDIDDDADSLEYEILAQPAHGDLSGTAPRLTYTPDPNWNGSKSSRSVRERRRAHPPGPQRSRSTSRPSTTCRRRSQARGRRRRTRRSRSRSRRPTSKATRSRTRSSRNGPTAG